VIIAVAVMVLGVVSVLAVPKSWYNRDALAKQNGTGKYTGALTPEQRAKVLAELPKLETFVATKRGSAFPTGTEVEFLSNVQFRHALAYARPETDGVVAPIARALGFARSARRASLQARHLNKADIVGLSIGTKILIRGNQVGPEFNDILVHELTHTFDQSRLSFDVTRARGASTPDGREAVAGLIEGDATEVQADYLDSIGANLGCQVMGEFLIPFDATCRAEHYTNALHSINPGDIAAPTEAYQQFPYTVGTLFVRALIARDGEAAVDRAFAHPPIDTAQVLEPALYFSHVGPVPVKLPTIRQRVTRRGSLGALGISVLLTHGGLDLGRRGYLRGWAGDSYVEDSERGRVCLHDRLQLRSAASARTAVRRFTAWAKQQPGRVVGRDGATSLTFVSCR